MEVYEIAGYKVGPDRSGVNFLQPSESFEYINDGLIYRQELKSRLGFRQFGNRLGNQPGDNADGTRVMGIFENVNPSGNGTRELLVCTKKYLYSYDSATEIFKQIPFASVVLITDFNITNNEDYVSGTTYLDKDGAQRFVLTGKGMSDVYFYDGTDVKRYTNKTDNPDYEPRTPGSVLTRATKVHWFGERINFFDPVIDGTRYHQGILYSGIRDTSGKGDQFNVAGSGLLQADTYELMKGTAIFGDMIIITFQNSTWFIQKTRDAFNPYFIQKIPSVLGTDATFSPVNWAYNIKSLGETGLLSCDGRQSQRFDNKIPYFTRDEIQQDEIELTYGGFDRISRQFLFSYREAGTQLTDVTQTKVLAYNYEEDSWSNYNMRFSCFGQTNNGKNKTWADISEANQASWARWDTTDDIWNKIGVTEDVQKTLAGDNEGYVYRLNVDYDDYQYAITDITQAAEAVVTCANAFKKGDRVFVENVSGMTEINDNIYDVLESDGATVTLFYNSTDATAYTTGGLISKVIDFQAKLNPFNPYRQQGRRCYVSHMDVLINNNAGSLYVDIFDDDDDTPLKSDIPLIPDKDSIKSRQWITISIDHEADFLNFLFKKENANQPIVISSIRLYCKPGGKTSY